MVAQKFNEPILMSDESNLFLFFLLIFWKTGFCGETEDEFNDTLMVMRQVKYHVAFMFAYSMREVILFGLD